MAIKDDDLLYVQRPTGLDSGKYKETYGNIKAELLKDVDSGGITQDEADDRYLRIDADAPDQTRVAGKATFEAGIGVENFAGKETVITTTAEGSLDIDSPAQLDEGGNVRISVSPDATSSINLEGTRSGGSGWTAGSIAAFSGQGSTELSWMRFATKDLAANAAKEYVFLRDQPNSDGNEVFGTAEDTDFAIGWDASDGLTDVAKNAPIYMGSDGNARFNYIQGAGLEFIQNRTSKNVHSRGIVYSSTNKALLSTNRPNAANQDVDVFLARTDNTKYDADDNRTPVNVGTATSFKAESPFGDTSGQYGTYKSYVGFQATNNGNDPSKDAVWTGEDNCYGFLSGVANRTVGTGQTYNFYAAGNAPNFFRGQVNIHPNTLVPEVMNQGKGYLKLYATTESGSDPAAAPITISGSDNGTFPSRHLLAMVAGNDVAGSVRSDTSGNLSLVNPSDYRLKTNIQTVTESVANKVKNLNVVSYTDRFDNNVAYGFVAHELQEQSPEAVFGEKDETVAVGTLTDWDGTELETEVTEPSAEELTYIEEVETDGVATMVTRTRSWNATGTRDVYQGVDATKLIPLLTKALQEALERIEVLEADHATMMNNNSGGGY